MLLGHPVHRGTLTGAGALDASARPDPLISQADFRTTHSKYFFAHRDPIVLSGCPLDTNR